eukprot:TRINITY_DN21967_c0_g1_i1.p1 TRINITY_DN21967_c0_g1~~TRINITY_DN21967_c0_g1_i1.p1  ORF type:complete len:127 (-),score=9.47 TRINITY_DN21967_c0_g1_i1:10-390(-)
MHQEPCEHTYRPTSRIRRHEEVQSRRETIVASISNRYTRLIGIEHPIIQEGLGPFRTPKLAAAVSNAGGLGTVSMPGMPEDLSEGARTFRAHIEECASLTSSPFAVKIGRAVQQECRDRSRMPSSA